MRAELCVALRRGLAALLAAALFWALCLTASAASTEATSAETSTETPTETPIETPTETPIATPTETPIATPAETPTASPTASPTATPAESPPASPAATSEAEESGTLPVYIDGLLYGRARIEDGAVLISPDCVCSFLGYAMDFKADAGTLVLSASGVELKAQVGREYMTANGRYLYEPQGWTVEDGTLFLPLDAVARLFTLDIKERFSPHRVEIGTEKAAPISGGEDYYELNYLIEDLFWLAQVIHSESYQQPLAGQIGVGNVVMNRVASPDFPDSIFGVVFDVEGVVQFEPVSTGGIYVTPDEQSQVAARLCLEGYNTVGGSLYFVNPSKGSFWFDKTLDLVTAIGDHNFYK